MTTLRTDEASVAARSAGLKRELGLSARRDEHHRPGDFRRKEALTVRLKPDATYDESPIHSPYGPHRDHP
jgi:hypothetical protein